jgi:hypothetical protein
MTVFPSVSQVVPQRHAVLKRQVVKGSHPRVLKYHQESSISEQIQAKKYYWGKIGLFHNSPILSIQGTKYPIFRLFAV